MNNEKDNTEVDLRQVLTEFWLNTISGQGPEIEFTDRIKASELLAKHILGEGKTPVKRRGPQKPPTRSILEEIAKLEREQDMEEEDGEETS